jgi:restriction system protein
MTTSSDDYEQFVRQVVASLVGVTVHHKRVYTGRVSHREIEVDVSFNYDVAGADLLFLVECKCYGHAVPVNDVEEFHSKIDDIGAHKGIMVTTRGFQDGAIRTARGRGIALALLTTEHQPGELQ